MTKTSQAAANSVEIVEKVADIILRLLNKNDATERDLAQARVQINELTVADEENAALINASNSKLSQLLEAATAAVVPTPVPLPTPSPTAPEAPVTPDDEDEEPSDTLVSNS